MLKRRTLLLGIVALPLGLASCATKPAGGDKSSFPVTIKHALGQTTIPSLPTRIATLGYASHDICAALGVPPVGVEALPERGYGLSLWFSKSLTNQNFVFPQTYPADKTLPLEQLRQLRPDVILAVNSAITAKGYEQLIKIAPVVAYPDIPLGTDWRTSTTMIGQVLGRASQAKDVIAATEAAIRKSLEGYSTFNGTSFIYAGVARDFGADLQVVPSQSNSIKTLQDFGLVLSDSMSNIERVGLKRHLDTGSDAIMLPVRDIQLFKASVHVIAVKTEDYDQIQSSGVLDPILAVAKNSLVQLKSGDDALALFEASPLSVQWAAWTVVPAVARAAYEARKSS
ncbi:ABC transporter substrate-binding protein [Psychromicrobium xiongbiense]|uniref:ABC transporter substrate-binding protein n=1 Tax=Psychromicrobium xiongbiense TaxID=3051184 RepID=UPI0025572403|nr:ABC transporter substrate-binding protein [Psychromicrobium sp. YIM S02556]